MIDYQIQPNSRRCAETGRELQAGERFFSVLLEEDHQIVRRDFCKDGWQGPPAGAIGFWTGVVPANQDKVKPRFDDDLLEECFHRLEGQTEPSRLNFRYVVALLLMRRKRFKFDTSAVADGVEKMILHCTRSGAKYEVINPRLNDEEMLQVQQEVFQVLGWK